MKIDDLAALATVLLAISLASERLVVMVKTLFPTWLVDEKKKPDTQEVDIIQDKWRRFAVQILAFAAAWITSAFLAEYGFDLFGFVQVHEKAVPVIVLGILGSGGSAFWNYVLGYSKALKDTQQQARESLAYQQMADQGEVVPADGVVASRIRRLGLKAPQMRQTMEKIAQLQQPPYNLSNSRLSQ